jgi:hypothetical protein
VKIGKFVDKADVKESEEYWKSVWGVSFAHARNRRLAHMVWCCVEWLCGIVLCGIEWLGGVVLCSVVQCFDNSANNALWVIYDILTHIHRRN